MSHQTRYASVSLRSCLPLRHFSLALRTEAARLDVTSQLAPEQAYSKSLLGHKEEAGTIEDVGSAWNVGAGLASQQRNPDKRVCWQWWKKNALFSTGDEGQVEKVREGCFPC